MIPYDPPRFARELPPALVARLEACLGERFTRSSGVRAHHGHDESHFPDQPPQAVAFVISTEEVVEVVPEYGVPLIPYGTGTSLEGHVLALYGGVSVDVSQMNHVLEIDAEDMLAVVQPGVTRKQLNVDASGLIAPILGHVGDGNFHTVILIDPEDAAELERAKALSAELVAIAQSLGGTCSGEHGVGMGKREFVAREAGEVGVAVMRAIKVALDPQGIFNPGKLVP